MYLNGDIILQLYLEVTGKTRKNFSVERANKGFVMHPVSDKPDCLKPFYRFFYAVGEAFPNYKLLLDNIMVKENRVMAHYTISGIQKMNFLGLEATNEPMAITGIDIFRLDQGEVIEYWDAAHQLTSASKDTRNLPSCGHPRSLVMMGPENKQLSLST